MKDLEEIEALQDNVLKRTAQQETEFKRKSLQNQ